MSRKLTQEVADMLKKRIDDMVGHDLVFIEVQNEPLDILDDESTKWIGCSAISIKVDKTDNNIS